MAREDEDRLEVYCDGSPTDATLIDPYRSELGGELVGRAIVLIPERDFGVIKQTREGIRSGRGNPDSIAVETFAIRTALAACATLGVSDVVIYSDCQEAVRRTGDSRVEWRCRADVDLPNRFFDKLLRRAAYLRASAGKVKTRMPLQPYQQEIFEMWHERDRQFALSQSELWKWLKANPPKR